MDMVLGNLFKFIIRLDSLCFSRTVVAFSQDLCPRHNAGLVLIAPCYNLLTAIDTVVWGGNKNQEAHNVDIITC